LKEAGEREEREKRERKELFFSLLLAGNNKK
jgi:hypothetical protein